MKRKENLKIFFISMISTLYIIALFVGFVIVEKTANKIINEEAEDFMVCEKNEKHRYKISVHFMGKNFIFNV